MYARICPRNWVEAMRLFYFSSDLFQFDDNLPTLMLANFSDAVEFVIVFPPRFQSFKKGFGLLAGKAARAKVFAAVC